jgi:hypothetical protein
MKVLGILGLKENRKSFCFSVLQTLQIRAKVGLLAVEGGFPRDHHHPDAICASQHLRHSK